MTDWGDDMKYINANDVLPANLLEQIQEYVQGEYLYIPVRDKAVSYTHLFYWDKLCDLVCT